MADLTSPTYRQRFSTVTPDDHGAYIYIAAFLTVTYCSGTFIARCFIKRKVFGIDDWAACIGQATFVIQFTFLVIAVSAGLGRNYKLLKEAEYSRMASAYYGNQITLYLALGVAKVSTLMLVRRLFTRDSRKYRIMCNAVCGLLVSWTAFAAFLVSVGCSPASTTPRNREQICNGISSRYKVVAITDAVTDTVLVAIPVYLVCQLRMTTKLKLQVITVFAFRLPLLPLSILSLRKYEESLSSSNPGVDLAPAVVFQQSELCVSLIAATLPCLKSFIRSFDTGGGLNVNYSTEAWGSSGHGKGQSYRMQSLVKDGSASYTQDPDKADLRASRRQFQPDLRSKSYTGPASNVITTAYTSGRPKEADASSHSSQELFIRRDVQWEVHSENLSQTQGNQDIAELEEST